MLGVIYPSSWFSVVWFIEAGYFFSLSSPLEERRGRKRGSVDVLAIRLLSQP